MSIHGHRNDHNYRNVDFSEKQLAGKNFTGCDFTGAHMRGTRFVCCSLVGATFHDCDLEDADFSGCSLARSDFSGARATGANFRHADLREANLAGIVAPPPCAFGGANLTDADMGPNPVYEKFLVVADQIRQLGGSIFIMLSITAYCWLTIVSTQDETLFNDFSFQPLPIINTDIRYPIFYFAAPILLLAIYTYNLLLAYQIWGNLRHLPAIFPDGQPLSEKLPSWFPVAVAGWVLPHLRSKQFLVYLLAGSLSFLLIWCLPPLTILGFWARYIVVHDLAGSLTHVAIFGIALLTGIAGLRLTAAALGRSLSVKVSPAALAIDMMVAIAATAAMTAASRQAIADRPTFARHLDAAYGDGGHLIPNLLQSLGFRNYANLMYQPLTEKFDERKAGKIARMANADLRYANAYGAYMAYGDLFGLNAESARLGRANMSSTDLRCANLANADLYDANLADADLQGTRLDNVRFGANADLGNAKLMNTWLYGADMSELDEKRTPPADFFADACYDDSTRFPPSMGGPPPKARRDCSTEKIQKICLGLDFRAPPKEQRK